MDDLNAGKLEDVQEFFNTYYAPNNATLTVVGDFDKAEAKRMIQEYFGGIRRGPAPPPVTCNDPFGHLPVRETIVDNNASLPAFFASYGIPAVDSNDIYAITLLGNLLGSGESSRLNQRLVQTERAAVATQAFLDIRRGPGVFVVFAIPNQGVGVDRIEALIKEELDKIHTHGITADEMQKAKNRYRASTIRSYQTVLGKADRLQYFAHFYDDPAMINSIMDRYMAVTPQDIQRVARQYLVPTNRAVIITQPPAAKEQP
jgi:predicted Zn-dependent peptidase